MSLRTQGPADQELGTGLLPLRMVASGERIRPVRRLASRLSRAAAAQQASRSGKTGTRKPQTSMSGVTRADFTRSVKLWDRKRLTALGLCRAVLEPEGHDGPDGSRFQYQDVFSLEVRNGYILRLRLVRDETPSATRGAAPDAGPWHLAVDLEHQNQTHPAFNFPSYSSAEERDEAQRRVWAYMDGLRPRPRQVPSYPDPFDRRQSPAPEGPASDAGSPLNWDRA